MEDHNISFYTNSTWDDDNRNYFVKLFLVDTVVNYIIVSAGIPLSAVAVYALYSLVRNDGIPSLVYIINLLFSDIIQICSLIVTLTPSDYLTNLVFAHVYIFCLLTSVALMACIALKRYLLVAWPLWYSFKRPNRTPTVVCVLVWISCAVISAVFALYDTELTLTIFSILFFLPIPLFIFCLGGTLRALSSCRLPADEKRRIMAVLVLVLLIHTLLFLPAIITVLTGRWSIFYDLPFILIRLNPLADVVLYVVIQDGAVYKLLASVCCCKLNCCKSSISSA